MSSLVPTDRLISSYVTLFWAMFSLTTPTSIEIQNGQHFTQTIAELLFMAYHFMAIVLLLNMLIAMMSNSFQDIEVRDRFLVRT